jgi:hypothetical protein
MAIERSTKWRQVPGGSWICRNNKSAAIDKPASQCAPLSRMFGAHPVFHKGICQRYHNEVYTAVGQWFHRERADLFEWDHACIRFHCAQILRFSGTGC